MNLFKKLKLLKVLMDGSHFYEIYRAGNRTNVWRFENSYMDEEKIALVKQYLIERGNKQ